MNDPATFPSFEAFSAILREKRVLSAHDAGFLRHVYRLAKRCDYLKAKGQEEARRISREELAPVIRWCDSLSKALRRVQRECEATKVQAQKIPAPPHHWNVGFHTVEEALEDICASIATIRQRAIDGQHARLRYRKHEPRWDLLIPRYDYPLDKLGWKAADTWLIGELDQVISLRWKTIPSGDRYRLIQAMFIAAFKDEKTLKTIAVAVFRARRKRSTSVE